MTLSRSQITSLNSLSKLVRQGRKIDVAVISNYVERLASLWPEQQHEESYQLQWIYAWAIHNFFLELRMKMTFDARTTQGKNSDLLEVVTHSVSSWKAVGHSLCSFNQKCNRVNMHQPTCQAPGGVLFKSLLVLLGRESRNNLQRFAKELIRNSDNFYHGIVSQDTFEERLHVASKSILPHAGSIVTIRVTSLHDIPFSTRRARYVHGFVIPDPNFQVSPEDTRQSSEPQAWSHLPCLQPDTGLLLFVPSFQVQGGELTENNKQAIFTSFEVTLENLIKALPEPGDENPGMQSKRQEIFTLMMLGIPLRKLEYLDTQSCSNCFGSAVAGLQFSCLLWSSKLLPRIKPKAAALFVSAVEALCDRNQQLFASLLQVGDACRAEVATPLFRKVFAAVSKRCTKRNGSLPSFPRNSSWEKTTKSDEELQFIQFRTGPKRMKLAQKQQLLRKSQVTPIRNPEAVR